MGEQAINDYGVDNDNGDGEDTGAEQSDGNRNTFFFGVGIL